MAAVPNAVSPSGIIAEEGRRAVAQSETMHLQLTLIASLIHEHPTFQMHDSNIFDIRIEFILQRFRCVLLPLQRLLTTSLRKFIERLRRWYSTELEGLSARKIFFKPFFLFILQLFNFKNLGAFIRRICSTREEVTRN